MVKSSTDLLEVRVADALLAGSNHPQQAKHLLADNAIQPVPHVPEMLKLNAQLATQVISSSKTAVASNALVFALIAMMLVSTALLAVTTLN